jgi:hypothetical protein
MGEKGARKSAFFRNPTLPELFSLRAPFACQSRMH